MAQLASQPSLTNHSIGLLPTSSRGTELAYAGRMSIARQKRSGYLFFTFCGEVGVTGKGQFFFFFFANRTRR